MASRNEASGARIGMLFLASVAAVAPVVAQPTPPVRVIAEWEPAVGTLISYPFGIPKSLAIELAKDDMLFVLVTGQGAEDQAKAKLISWGVDLGQVEFIHCPVQSHWPRDWGPHQIFDGNGEWGIVDPIFEGYPWVDVPCEPLTSPGGHQGDDAVNIDVAAHFDAPLHTLPAYLTGGNFLVDGHQAAFSTCTMVDENSQLWTEEQFLALAEQYVGIGDYHIVDNTEDYGIQHIDCWFKPLDEETLLVKRPPAWHEEYDRIEANLEILAEATTCYGRPYNIIRIDCPPYNGYSIAAYTNSLILNKKILVPLFGIPGDEAALQTFEQAMPGYEVIGFPWGYWYYYDALHCRTRAIFDRYMLRITHRRLDEEVPLADEYPVAAFIDDRSEAGLIADELRVWWRPQGAADWDWRLLTPTGMPDIYTADIPGQTMGTTVEYYIAAADNSGRAETLPRTAPAGFYSFTIVDTGLTIEVPDPPLIIAPWTLTTFEVTIDPGDEELVPGTALLHHRYDGGEYLISALEPLGAEHYQATLPRALCDHVPEFYVSAEGSESGVKTAPPGAPEDVFSAEVGELVPIITYSERFEDGLPEGWSVSGLWHVTEACEITPPCDGSHWAYYGLDDTCNYDTGDRNSGVLTSAPIELPSIPPGGDVTLSYCSHFQTEDEPGYDLAGLYVNGVPVDQPDQSEAWEERTVDLTAFAEQSIVLEWAFDTIDEYYNDFHGWQVDRVIISASEVECDFEHPLLLGDLNCDGEVDFNDINPFVLALSDPALYEQTYPGCPFENRDINGDGDFNFADINPFVALLNR